MSDEIKSPRLIPPSPPDQSAIEGAGRFGHVPKVLERRTVLGGYSDDSNSDYSDNDLSGEDDEDRTLRRRSKASNFSDEDSLTDDEGSASYAARNRLLDDSGDDARLRLRNRQSLTISDSHGSTSPRQGNSRPQSVELGDDEIYIENVELNSRGRPKKTRKNYRRSADSRESTDEETNEAPSAFPDDPSAISSSGAEDRRSPKIGKTRKSRASVGVAEGVGSSPFETGVSQDLQGLSKRSLKKLMRASLSIDFAPAEGSDPDSIARNDQASTDSLLDSTTSGGSAPRKNSVIGSADDAMLMEDDASSSPVSAKAQRVLSSPASKKNLYRRKSLAMMDKLLSKSGGAKSAISGPRAVRYSSNFFAQYETFATSPLLKEDPLSHIYTTPVDDLMITQETRSPVPSFAADDRLALLKLGDNALQNPNWLLEGYKMVTHGRYRVVNWKYFDLGSSANRASESTAPGAFAYRTVPKGGEPAGVTGGSFISSQYGPEAGSSSSTPPSINLPDIDEHEEADSIAAISSTTAGPRGHRKTHSSAGLAGINISPSHSSSSVPSTSAEPTTPRNGAQAPSSSSPPAAGAPALNAQLQQQILQQATKQKTKKKRATTPSVSAKDSSTSLFLPESNYEYADHEHELRHAASKVHIFKYYTDRDRAAAELEKRDHSESSGSHARTISVTTGDKDKDKETKEKEKERDKRSKTSDKERLERPLSSRSSRRRVAKEMPDFSRSHVPHPFEFVGAPNKLWISVEATNLVLPEIPAEEPVFCTLSLHNISTMTKVSEDFSFELSNVTQLAALDRNMAVSYGGILSTHAASSKNAVIMAASNQAQGANREPASVNMGSKCVFQITGDANDYYYLILRISRVYMPEDQSKTLYHASSTSSSKRDSTTAGNAPALAPGSIPYFYRAPYAFGAVQLTTKPGLLPTTISNLIPVKHASSFDHIYDLLRNEKELKKIRPITGSLFMSCGRVNLYDSSDLQEKLINPQLDPYFPLDPRVAEEAKNATTTAAAAATAATASEDSDPNEKKDKKEKRSKKGLKREKTEKSSSHISTSTSQASDSPRGFDPTKALEVSKETGKSSVVKAIQELGSENLDFLINSVNHLYIFPKRFTLKGNTVKDLQIEVRFKDSDHSPNHTDGGLAAFYGSSFEPKFTDVVISNVCKGEKHIEFAEEWKLKLPYVLTAVHHLLFTFYEFDLKKQKRSLVGYSVLPILSPADSQLALSTLPLQLNVYPELPNHYMINPSAHLETISITSATSGNSSSNPVSFLSQLVANATGSSTSGSNNTMSPAAADLQKKSRGSFVFSSTLVSSVYTLDPILSRFFFAYRRYPKKGDPSYDALLDIVPAMTKISRRVVFRHFPLIFNLLISLMCSCVPASYARTGSEPTSAQEDEKPEPETAPEPAKPNAEERVSPSPLRAGKKGKDKVSPARETSPPPSIRRATIQNDTFMPPPSSHAPPGGSAAPGSVAAIDTVLGRETLVTLLHLIAKVNSVTPGQDYSIYLRAYISYMFDNTFFYEDVLTRSSSSVVTSSNEKNARSSREILIGQFGSASSGFNRDVYGDGPKEPHALLRSLPYEAIVNLLSSLHQAGYFSNSASKFEAGWFLFGIITKSMALHLVDASLLQEPRIDRFSNDYTAKLQTMMLLWLSERYMATDTQHSQSMALFLKDLFGLIDRGAVLTMLRDYLEMTRKGKSGLVLESYKFTLLKILCNYEHLTSINLPLAPSGKELDSLELMTAYLIKLRERHPIAGELMQEIEFHLRDNEMALKLGGASGVQGEKSPLIRGATHVGEVTGPALLLALRDEAILVLRRVLTKHELDPRLQDAKAQQRVASMYFPYIIALASKPQPIFNMTKAEREEWLVCFLYVARNVKRRLLLQWLHFESLQVQVQFWSLIELSLTSFSKLTLSRQADLLAVDLVASALYEYSKDYNNFAFAQADSTQQTTTNPVLRKLIVLMQQLVSKSISGLSPYGPAAKPMSAIPAKLVSSPTPINMTPSNSASSIKDSAPSSTTTSPAGSPGSAKLSVSSASASATSSTAAAPPPSLHVPSISLNSSPLTHSLTRQALSLSNTASMPVQDEGSLANLFFPMQTLLEKCSLALFANSSTPGELFQMLLLDFLSYCNHMVSGTLRSYGASMLYLLLTQARKVMGDDLMRMKVDLAVGTSKLVGTTSNSKRRVFAPLLTSITAIKKFAYEQQLQENVAKAERVEKGETSDSAEVCELWYPKFEEIVNHMVKLIEDSSKLEMNVKDPEMMQDLYISIERSFIGSPALRITWLENLSQLHIDNEDYEEAAECRVHIASMVVYAMMTSADRGPNFSRKLPADWHNFPMIAPSLKNCDDTRVPAEASARYLASLGGTADASNATRKLLLDTLRQSALLFDKASRYELALESYNNMLQFLRMDKEWPSYLQVLKEEQEATERLMDVHNPVERAYPVYFRVAFYGSKWGAHLDGKQFIYKKTARFNLSTFKKQLEEQFVANVQQQREMSEQRQDSLVTSALESPAADTLAIAQSSSSSDLRPLVQQHAAERAATGAGNSGSTTSASTQDSADSHDSTGLAPPTSSNITPSASNDSIAVAAGGPLGSLAHSQSAGSVSSPNLGPAIAAANAASSSSSGGASSAGAGPTLLSVTAPSTPERSSLTLAYNPSDVAALSDLVILTNDTVKVETLDSGKAYVQMTGVSPYFNNDELDAIATFTDQHFAVNRFAFETPFSEDGGKPDVEDLAKLCKRKTIFKTNRTFPYIKTRIEIGQVDEITLSPIENAIELMKQQTVKIRAVMERPIRPKSIQQILQGSVVPMVNPGPRRICDIFLSPEAFHSKKYSHKHLRELSKAMLEFSRLCAFGVKFNNKLEGSAKFQEMIEDFQRDLAILVQSKTSAMEALINSHSSSS